MATNLQPKPRIGFIGLGAMGRPMAQSLVDAGYPVVGYDVSPGAVEAFVAGGGQGATSPPDVAGRVELVFTMLPTAADVETVLVGSNGAAGAASPGTTFVDTSTIDPATMHRVASVFSERGLELLDGGVSGSVAMAAEHRVTLMIGGQRPLFDRWRPVLEALCATLIYTGPLGSAKVCKLANNLVAAISMAALSEAFRLTTLHGVDNRVVHRAMTGSWANGAVQQTFPPVPGVVPTSPADHGFAPAFSVDYMAKDVGYALLAAQAAGGELPVAALVQQLYQATSAMGEGGLDFSAVYHAIERLGREPEGERSPVTASIEAMPRTSKLESELWPALRSFWHPVARSSDVDPGPTSARLLGESLVLTRLDGEVRCFRDLCIHRGTPLSLGWIEGSSLVCTYHGWQYGPDGRCIRIPALPPGRSIPLKARVDRFSAQERYGLIWVCLGEPEADIPAFPEAMDPGFTTYAAPAMSRTCSAARQVENFIDESHFAWVHEGILGDRDHPQAPAFDVAQTGTLLQFGWDERPNAIHPPGHRRDYSLTLPFSVHLRQARHGGNECETLFFAVCPAAARESTGFLLIARNYTMPEQDEQRRRDLTATVQEQDRRIVENQRPEEVPFDLAAELHIKGPDTAAVAYRRAMAELGVLVDS